jgi:hypothetical protein
MKSAKTVDSCLDRESKVARIRYQESHFFNTNGGYTPQSTPKCPVSEPELHRFEDQMT